MTHQSTKIYPILFLAGIAIGALFLPRHETVEAPTTAVNSVQFYTATDAIAQVLGVQAELLPKQEKINLARQAAVATEDSAPTARSYLDHLVELGEGYVPGEGSLTEEEQLLFFYKAEYVKQQLKEDAYAYADFWSTYLEDRFTGNEDGFTDADYNTYIADYLSGIAP